MLRAETERHLKGFEESRGRAIIEKGFHLVSVLTPLSMLFLVLHLRNSTEQFAAQWSRVSGRSAINVFV